MTDPLLKDQIIADVVRGLDINDLSDEAKQAALAGVGENVLARILLEVFTILPEPKRAEFREMLGTASPLRIYTYLEPYVTDVPAFISRAVQDEIAETKALLAEA